MQAFETFTSRRQATMTVEAANRAYEFTGYTHQTKGH